MEDQTIVRLLWERSEEALNALAAAYGPLLLQLAENIVGNREDAEECVNDAYLAVWQRIPPVRPSSLKAFCCRIVRNIALDRYDYNRAEKRSAGQTLYLEELEELIPDRRSVEDSVQASELAALLQSFLKRQKTQLQWLFIRRYWYNESFEELKQECGLPESTLRSRLSRLKKQLKKELKKQGY